MNFEALDFTREKFNEEPPEEIDPKYLEIEQSENELDPWTEALDFAKATIGKVENLSVRDASQHILPEFTDTIIDVAYQGVKDSAADYFIADGRTFDPYNRSHATLAVLELYERGFLSRATSRLGKYYPTLEKVLPKIKMETTAEGYRSVSLRMEGCGVIKIFDNGVADRGQNPMQYGIELDFSQPRETQLGGQKVLDPFKKVRLNWTQQSDLTWERSANIQLCDLYADLGYNKVLIDHPILRVKELVLLGHFLQTWLGVGTTVSRKDYVILEQKNLEEGFRARVRRYVRTLEDIDPKALDVESPKFDTKAITILNAWADKSSYVQGKLFSK